MAQIDQRIKKIDMSINETTKLTKKGSVEGPEDVPVMHCLVAGAPVQSENILEIRSPYDNRIVGKVPLANSGHARAAIEAALNGKQSLSRYDRHNILEKARELLIA